MRNFLNAIKDFPHAEKRPAGASRSTHNRDTSNFLIASKAGTRESGVLGAALDPIREGDSIEAGLNVRP